MSIEFSEIGTVVGTYLPTRVAATSDPDEQPRPLDDWLIERLARGEVVAVSIGTDKCQAEIRHAMAGEKTSALRPVLHT